MQILAQSFYLPKQKHEQALQAMKQVDQSLISEKAFIGWNDQDDSMDSMRKRCRAWGLDEDTPILESLAQAPTVEQFLGLLDYDVEKNEDGDIVKLVWTGNYWQRYTHACLETIAPLVQAGSYIRARLSDGLIYLWTFTEGSLVETIPSLELLNLSAERKS